MAMRINSKQIEEARIMGRFAFRSDINHPEVFGPAKSPYADDFEAHANWEYIFKRKDITQENMDQLDVYWVEAYTEAWLDYHRDLMTPKTEADHKADLAIRKINAGFDALFGAI